MGSTTTPGSGNVAEAASGIGTPNPEQGTQVQELQASSSLWDSFAVARSEGQALARIEQRPEGAFSASISRLRQKFAPGGVTRVSRDRRTPPPYPNRAPIHEYLPKAPTLLFSMFGGPRFQLPYPLNSSQQTQMADKDESAGANGGESGMEIDPSATQASNAMPSTSTGGDARQASATPGATPNVQSSSEMGLETEVRRCLERMGYSSRDGPSDEHHEEGYGGDDESGNGSHSPIKKPKKTGPKDPAVNAFHKAGRAYLQAIRYLVPEGGPVSPSVRSETLSEFKREGFPDIPISDIRLDWESAFTTGWNVEALHRLAVDFEAELLAGKYSFVTYDERLMSLEQIKGTFQVQLKRARTERRKAKRETFDYDDEAGTRPRLTPGEVLKRRRDARRVGTFKRRTRIVVENLRNNPQLWGAIQDVLQQLTINGVSSDESEWESPSTQRRTGNKTVRRIKLAWMAKEVTDLVDAVETYRDALRDEVNAQRRGNASPRRLFAYNQVNNTREAVRGLPRNWYDDIWYKGLQLGARSWLNARKERAIPELAPYSGATYAGMEH